MRRNALLRCAAILAMLAVAGCSSGDPAADRPAGSVDGPAGAEELVTQGIVMQASPDSRVELCVGPIAESYPPQCRGPELLGEFSWDDVPAREQGGVRWSEEGYFAVGRYDRAADTFTLSRGLSATPPDGFVMPTSDPVEFPRLCEDPFRGGDPSSAADLAAQERLQRRLPAIDGYVTSWVSDAVSLFNVVVTADLAAAQEALTERSAEMRLTTAGSGGVSGVLEVGVIVADAETRALIHDVVGPWLREEQVRIVGAMVPLAEG